MFSLVFIKMLNSKFKVVVVRYFHTLKKRQSVIPLRRRVKMFAQQKVLGKYLFVTNTVGSGVLMAAGDCIQQHLELYKGGTCFDWRRSGDFYILKKTVIFDYTCDFKVL